MGHLRMLAIIGTLSIIVPFLGIPIFLKEVIFVLLGLVLAMSALRGYRLYQHSLKREQLSGSQTTTQVTRIG